MTNLHAIILNAILIDDRNIDYKDFFRRMCEKHPRVVLDVEFPHIAIAAEVETPETPESKDEQVRGECLTLSLKGKAVHAIKHYRANFSVDLKGAKDAVDTLNNRYYPGDELRLARMIVAGSQLAALRDMRDRFGQEEGDRQYHNLYRKVTEHVGKYPIDPISVD